MIKEKNKRIKQLLVILLLAASSMTLTLPREFFDPHPGVDYDIFCKTLYCLANDSKPVIIQITYDSYVIYSRVAADDNFISAEPCSLKNSRAPPSLQFHL